MRDYIFALSLLKKKMRTSDAPTPINPIKKPPDNPNNKMIGMLFLVIGISTLDLFGLFIKGKEFLSLTLYY